MMKIKERAREAVLRTQKTMRTDMIYVARGGFWLTAASVAAGLMSFALAVAFANLLPAHAYGVYKYVISVAGVLTAFSLTGLGTAMIRAVAQGHHGVLRDAVRTDLKWDLGITTAALSGAAWYHWHGNAELALGFLIVALFAPVKKAFSLCGAWYQGRKDFRTASLFRIAATTFPALVLIALLFITNSPEVLLLGFFLANASVAAALFLITLPRTGREEHLPDDAVPYAKHLSAMRVLSTAVQHLDKILVFQFLGAAPTAVYAFAQAIPEQVRGMTKNLHSLALPKFTENDPGTSRRELGRKMIVVGALLAFITAAYMIAAPYLFRFFFPQYLEAVPYSQALALTILFSGLGRLPNAWLTARKAIREKYVISTFGPGLRLMLMLFLVVPYGIWGIVIASLMAKAGGFLVQILLMYRHRIEH